MEQKYATNLHYKNETLVKSEALLEFMMKFCIGRKSPLNKASKEIAIILFLFYNEKKINL